MSPSPPPCFEQVLLFVGSETEADLRAIKELDALIVQQPASRVAGRQALPVATSRLPHKGKGKKKSKAQDALMPWVLIHKASTEASCYRAEFCIAKALKWDHITPVPGVQQHTLLAVLHAAHMRFGRYSSRHSQWIPTGCPLQPDALYGALHDEHSYFLIIGCSLGWEHTCANAGPDRCFLPCKI